MAHSPISNGESGLSVRNKLNEDLAELFDLTAPGDVATLEALRDNRAAFITALGAGAAGTALATVIANKYDSVTFRRAVANGIEAEIPMKVVTGDPGADALKVQLGSTGKWLAQRRNSNVIFLGKYGTWTEGADVTDNVVAAINDNPNGGTAIWPMGGFQIRYKNILLKSGWVHEPMFFGKTTITGVTGGATQTEAYTNSVFSIPTDAEYVAVRGFKAVGANDDYFFVHARNGGNNIVVEDIDCTEIGLFTTFYFRHAAFNYSSSTDSNRVKQVLIQRCTGAATMNKWGYIDLRYVDGCRVADCSAVGYDSGVLMWGGDSNTGVNGAAGNERKCKNILVERCRMVGTPGEDRGGPVGAGLSDGGIWGSMLYNVHVIGCYVENWDDVGLDFEGCQHCSYSQCVVKDCHNQNFSHFYYNESISFVLVTSIVTDGETNCHYRSWNVTGSPTNNARVRVAHCSFITENGIGLSYCDGGPVSVLTFEDNWGINSRFDLVYSEINYQGRCYFNRNRLRFTNTAPAEMNGTVTSATSSTLTDSSKNWQPHMFRGCTVTIVSGTGAGQTREIRPIAGGTINNGTTLQIGPAWTVTPDATSVYRIDFAAVVMGGGRYGDASSWQPGGIVCEDNEIVGIGGNQHYSRAIVFINKADTSAHCIADRNKISRFATAVHLTGIMTNGGRTIVGWCFRNFLSNMHSAVSVSSTTVSGSPTVTVDTTDLKPYMLVSGTGIPAGTAITAVNTDGTITLSANATASGTVSLSYVMNRWTAENSSGGASGSTRFMWQDNYEHSGDENNGGYATVRSPRVQASVDLSSTVSLVETTVDIAFPNARTEMKFEVRAQSWEQSGFLVRADCISNGSVRVYARNLTGGAVDPISQTITVYPDGLAA